MHSQRRLPPWTVTALLLTVMSLAGLTAYLPGLSGGFIFDDNTNIVSNENVQIHDLSPSSLETALASGVSGPLKRPISMLSFALNYYFGGLNAYFFKLTNVVIHLINGIGLFFLTRLILAAYRTHFEARLSDRQVLWTSFAVSAAWLLHPLNLTSVLYVVQRMNSLAALFVIWGLVLYMAGRRRLNGGAHGMAMIVAAVTVFTPLAVLSKENGALLPVFMLVLEATLFGFQTVQPRHRRQLFVVFGLTVALPALLIGAYSLVHPQWFLAGYHTREFTLSERALTETRILWYYIKEILIPSNGQLGLFHDDIGLSHGLLSPAVTLFSAIGLVLLLAAAFACRRRAPLVTLGLAWFFVGQSMESTVLPLELAFEHRNYLPDYGILLFTVYYLLYPFAFTQLLRGRQALAGAFVVMLAVGTTVRASDWGNPALQAVTTVAHHPDSPRANNFAGRIYITLAQTSHRPADKKKYTLKALHYFERSARLPGNNVDGAFGALLTLHRLQRPLDPRLVHQLTDRLQHQPFASNTPNQFTWLVKCEERGRCRLPLDVTGRLFQAALANPTLTGTRRTIMLSVAAEHLFNFVGNRHDAVDFARQAVAIAPRDPVMRLNYAEFLTAAGDLKQARKQLRKAKALDTWGVYSKRIASEEQVLAQAGAAGQPGRDATSRGPAPPSKPEAARRAQTGA